MRDDAVVLEHKFAGSRRLDCPAAAGVLDVLEGERSGTGLVDDARIRKTLNPGLVQGAVQREISGAGRFDGPGIVGI